MPEKEGDEIKTQPAVSSNTMEDSSDDLGLGGSCLKSSGLGANTSSTKVNAFSRLMAPEGKTQKNKIGFSGNDDGGFSLQQLSETEESGVAGQ